MNNQKPIYSLYSKTIAAAAMATHGAMLLVAIALRHSARNIPLRVISGLKGLTE